MDSIQFPLIIDTLPKGASIKLLNSELSYKRDMFLTPGDYQVEVSKQGFQSKS